MKRKLALGLLFALIAASFTLLYVRTRPFMGDPDRFYHLALSREMAASDQLFLRSLPQVEDLGWGEYFIDKEFLFHQLTTIGYRIAGEVGAEGAAVLCTLAAFLAVLLFAGGRLPPLAAAATALFAFSCPFFVARILLLRPHVMAILGFVLMNIAVVSRRPLATAFAVFFFTLSYHAFYVPLACLLSLLPLSLLDRENGAAWRKVAYAGIFGCLCGILANPYFPGNIEIALIHAKIPGMIRGELADLNFGGELFPLRSDAFFEVFHSSMLVIFLGVFVAGFELREKGAAALRRRIGLLYLLGVAGLFLYIGFQTRRAGEYLGPAAGLLAVYLLAGLERIRFGKALMVALPLALAVWQGSLYWKAFRVEFGRFDGQRFRETKAALEQIPEAAAGAKIYNCEWDFTPYVFYLRPKLHFVDILDPSLLYFANRGAFRARDNLRKGFLADAYGMIRNAAKASYVLCNDPSVVMQLGLDPGFRQLYPEPGRPSLPALFELRESAPPAYVKEFLVADLGAYSAEAMPESGQQAGEPVELGATSYLDLAGILAQSGKGDLAAAAEGSFCARVRPAPAELRRHAGASLLGIGGGQGVEVFRGGKPLFRSVPPFSQARSLSAMVPLDPPLRANEELEFLVCAAAKAPFWGLSLSFFSEQELEQACHWKSAAPLSKRASLGWSYLGTQRQGCLAPMAAPAGPRAKAR